METPFAIRAMRVSTLPKLTFDDSARFSVLMSDVFPGVQVRSPLGKFRKIDTGSQPAVFVFCERLVLTDGSGARRCRT